MPHSRRVLHSKGNIAFTLIELLVVVAVIAILAAILLPALSTAKESGRRSKCVGNLRQMYLGLRLYADDNNGDFPLMNVGAWGDVNWATNGIFPYVGLKGTDQLPPYSIFTCPSVRFFYPWTPAQYNIYWLTYGFNGWLGSQVDPTVHWGSVYDMGGAKRGEAGDPASGATAGNTFLIGDGFIHNQYYDGYVGINTSPPSYPSPIVIPADLSYYGHSFGKGFNLLLLDGHVEYARFPVDRMKYKLGPLLHITGYAYYFDVPDVTGGW